ncbi:MAG: FGGY-family carbohydrate kinase [bacterium]
MILAIDLGSTSFKAAVFDSRLREVGGGGHRLLHRFGAGGQVELDVAVVETALRGALASARVATHDIQAIAITSQAQTFTVLDERGRAKGPFFSWQDRRSTAACEELKQKLPEFGEHTSFGNLGPSHQLSQIRHLQPGAKMRPIALPSYVLMLLTGETVTDNNMAAMSGLYSLPLKGWWPEALRGCGLREQQMSKVIPIGEVAAQTASAASRFGLKAGIPVVLAGNDQTAGGYAARLDTKESLLITLGTAQVAYACCRRMPPPRVGTIRGPYPGGRFYRMAADSCGGNVVNWAETVLAGCHDDAGFFREAQAAPAGSHGLVFDAALASGQGDWANLGLHHTRADLARSILEGLSRRMAELVKRLDLDLKGREVLAAGGGSLQPLWRKIVSDALGAKLVRTKANPLLGAARMAKEHV